MIAGEKRSRALVDGSGHAPVGHDAGPGHAPAGHDWRLAQNGRVPQRRK